MNYKFNCPSFSAKYQCFKFRLFTQTLMSTLHICDDRAYFPRNRLLTLIIKGHVYQIYFHNPIYGSHQSSKLLSKVNKTCSKMYYFSKKSRPTRVSGLSCVRIYREYIWMLHLIVFLKNWIITKRWLNLIINLKPFKKHSKVNDINHDCGSD